MLEKPAFRRLLFVETIFMSPSYFFLQNGSDVKKQSKNYEDQTSRKYYLHSMQHIVIIISVRYVPAALNSKQSIWQ